MSEYGWIITRDHLFDDDPSFGPSDIGTNGPSDIPPALLERLQHGEGRTFAMYDDDNIRYYTGRLVTTDDHDPLEYEHCPLQDFGEPHAGCTTIRYHQGSRPLRPAPWFRDLSQLEPTPGRPGGLRVAGDFSTSYNPPTR